MNPAAGAGASPHSYGVNPRVLLPLTAGYALLAVHDILRTSPEEGRGPLLWLAALVLVGTVAAAVALPGARLGPRTATGILAATGLGYHLALTAWTHGTPASGDNWPYAAQTLLLIVLALRAPAWAIPALYLLTFGIRTAHEPSGAAHFLVSQLPIVVAASFTSFVVRPQAAAIAALRETRVAAARDQAAAEAAVTARNARLDWIDGLAGPMLERLAGPTPPNAADRAAAALLEAEIRDQLRAPSLVGEPLDAVVRSLREAGTDVTLLDDGGAADPALAAAVRRGVAGILADHTGPRVIVRVAPPGRAHLVTVLRTDAAGRARHRMLGPGDVVVAAPGRDTPHRGAPSARDT